MGRSGNRRTMMGKEHAVAHNQTGTAPRSRNYTGGAEDQYEDQSEDMKRGVVRRPRPL